MVVFNFKKMNNGFLSPKVHHSFPLVSLHELSLHDMSILSRQTSSGKSVVSIKFSFMILKRKLPLFHILLTYSYKLVCCNHHI